MDSVVKVLQPVKDHFVVHVTCAQHSPDELLQDMAGLFSTVMFSMEAGALLRPKALQPIGVGPPVRALEGVAWTF